MVQPKFLPKNNKLQFWLSILIQDTQQVYGGDL